MTHVLVLGRKKKEIFSETFSFFGLNMVWCSLQDFCWTSEWTAIFVVVWAGITMSKLRLICLEKRLGNRVGSCWSGPGPLRYYSREAPLTPPGTNGWTNIFCWLKCWDDCMRLKLPRSNVCLIQSLSTSCWSVSSLNLIHFPWMSSFI